MKRILYFFLLASVITTACNDDKSKSDNDDKKVETQGDKKPVENGDAKNDLEKIKEDLEKMTPLTEDELKALVPAGLDGISHEEINASSSMGTAVVNTDYKINDSSTLQLEIVDCGGSGGSGMFGAQYINMINQNSDDEDEYIKTIDFNGNKAFENCKKKRNKCTLAYFEGKRFLISLTGENMSMDQLKKMAKEIKL